MSMTVIIDELKQLLSEPGWTDEIAAQFERVQILEEGAADMDEMLEVCKHLHLLSTMCRKGRKVGFTDEGGDLPISAHAGILAFKRGIEICEQLLKEGNKDFRITDQLNRSYYGISDLLLRAAKTRKEQQEQLRLLTESQTYARKQHDLLQQAVTAGADAYSRDFAAQFIAISEMQLEDIAERIRTLEAN